MEWHYVRSGIQSNRKRKDITTTAPSSPPTACCVRMCFRNLDQCVYECITTRRYGIMKQCRFQRSRQISYFPSTSDSIRMLAGTCIHRNVLFIITFFAENPLIDLYKSSFIRPVMAVTNLIYRNFCAMNTPSKTRHAKMLYFIYFVCS